MSSLLNRFWVVIAMIILLAAAGVVFTYPHWWYRIGSAEAQSPSGYVHGVAIYKSTSGEVLFVITEDSVIDQYIFYPSTGSVGIPNAGEFKMFFTPLLIYAKEVSVPTVLSTDRIKVDEDLNVVIDAKHVEFTTLHGLRLKADRMSF